jgi:transposase
VAALLEREGIDGLDALPGIGPVLAQAIAQMVRTGRWAQLERRRGAVAPEQLFQSIPGLGPEFARRIHEHPDADTGSARARAWGQRCRCSLLTEAKLSGSWRASPQFGAFLIEINPPRRQRG